jgi:hypothetical protein
MPHIPIDLVLSFYPGSRGFGFVLFEGPLSPFDWGVREIRGPNKNRRILKFLEELIDRYSPVAIVLEDWTDDACHRIERIVALYEAILALATKKLIPVIRIPMRKVREHFAYRNCTTKYEIAVHIATMIPAFGYMVPTLRRPWASERPGQLLYDCAALFAPLCDRREDKGAEFHGLR